MAREVRDLCDIGNEDEDVETWVLTNKKTGQAYEIDLCGPKHSPTGRTPPTLAKVLEKGRAVERHVVTPIKDQATAPLIRKMRNRPNEG